MSLLVVGIEFDSSLPSNNRSKTMEVFPKKKNMNIFTQRASGCGFMGYINKGVKKLNVSSYLHSERETPF